MSTAPLMALESVFDGSISKINKPEKNMVDIEIKQKNTDKTTVVRLPEKTMNDTNLKQGAKADFVADPNGHTLKIDNKPVAYLPNTTTNGLLHSKELK